MSKIESGRWSAMLRRMTGQKGQTLVAPELSPEISPTFQLERDHPEWGFLKGVRYHSGGITIGPVVGLPSTVRFRNPPQSGILAVLDKAWVNSNQAGSNFRIVFSQDVALADLAATLVAGTADSRWGTNRSSSIMSAETLAGGAGSIQYLTRLPADSWFEITLPFILAPDSSIDFAATDTNILLHVNLGWHERSIQPLEL